MFTQRCPGCGEEYIPVPGLDSGHAECVGKTIDIVPFHNYDDEEETGSV